jgi:YcxB-like protein
MQFEVRFTIEATDEAARMSRRWSYWPVFLVRNLYGLVIVAAIVFGGCSLLLKSLLSSKTDLPRAALGTALVAGPIAVFWWFRRRELRKATEMLAAINPLKLVFDAEGLHTLEKNGARNFVPWSSYDGFREGSKVILLREDKTGQYRIVPKNTVPETDSERMQSVIRSRLPEIH